MFIHVFFPIVSTCVYSIQRTIVPYENMPTRTQTRSSNSPTLPTPVASFRLGKVFGLKEKKKKRHPFSVVGRCSAALPPLLFYCRQTWPKLTTKHKPLLSIRKRCCVHSSRCCTGRGFQNTSVHGHEGGGDQNIAKGVSEEESIVRISNTTAHVIRKDLSRVRLQ